MTDDEKAFFRPWGGVLPLNEEMWASRIAELAEELSLSPQVVAHYEAGRQHIPASLLPELSEILEISVDEILGTTRRKANRRRSQLEDHLRERGKLARGRQQMVLNMLDAAIKTARN